MLIRHELKITLSSCAMTLIEFVVICVTDHGNDLTIDTDSFMIGQRVYVGGVRSGRITFIGEVHFAPGEWAGVVLDEPEGQELKFSVIEQEE